jgi:magnesium-transporting ATPase (P-type)
VGEGQDRVQMLHLPMSRGYVLCQLLLLRTLLQQVFAVVSMTGFSTAKGQLFNAILFPKPLSFRFYSDSWKFLFIMAMVALVAFTWSVTLLTLLGVRLRDCPWN